MSRIIADQLQEAQRLYASNIKQISQNEFNIIFDKANSFTVSLPSNYPTSAPRVFRGKSEFPTIMTQNWVPFFTLKHLIEHLQVFSKVSPPPCFEINKGEITNLVQSSNPETLKTKEDIQNLLTSKYQSTQQASKQVNYVSGKIPKEKEKVTQLSKEVSNSAKSLKNFCEKNSSQSTFQSPTNDKAAAIQMYRDEARKIDEAFTDIKDQMQTSEFQKNKQNYFNLFERKFLLEGLAQLLEDRLDI